MPDLLESVNVQELLKGANLLGLNISESELNQLQSGSILSLEGRGLGEIGSIFILAEALSKMNSVKNVTFEDLRKVIPHSSHGCGIPIYCWQCDNLR
ncbi:hypothetical protein [Aetokthonos hydrillicola]|uniref:hypothetical protein n=1 Tax=Aetokthonos hydrillicola TaxID=1550245 RepID=UPI001ABA50EB